VPFIPFLEEPGDSSPRLIGVSAFLQPHQHSSASAAALLTPVLHGHHALHYYAAVNNQFTANMGTLTASLAGLKSNHSMTNSQRDLFNKQQNGQAIIHEIITENVQETSHGGNNEDKSIQI